DAGDCEIPRLADRRPHRTGAVDPLAARGESSALHRGRRGAPMTRRDDRAYREYVREEQRSQRGCIAGRMQPEFHHGLLEVYRGGRRYEMETEGRPPVAGGHTGRGRPMSRPLPDLTERL